MGGFSVCFPVTVLKINGLCWGLPIGKLRFKRVALRCADAFLRGLSGSFCGIFGTFSWNFERFFDCEQGGDEPQRHPPSLGSYGAAGRDTEFFNREIREIREIREQDRNQNLRDNSTRF